MGKSAKSHWTRMQILTRFGLLAIAFSVLQLHKRLLQISLWILMMDCSSCLKFLTQGSEFGCAFLVFGRFSFFFNVLVLFLMLCLGLKVLQFSLHYKAFLQFLYEVRGKSSGSRSGFCPNQYHGEPCDAKVGSCRSFPSKALENSESLNTDDGTVGKELVNGGTDAKAEEDGDHEEEPCVEDGDSDAMLLREMVKIERERADAAFAELEKERLAAASAADEAMAMILRLQREKSALEIEAKQYRRMAEQKQEYNEEVIHSLQWMVMKHESERKLLEDQLRLYWEKLKLYVKDDELDQPGEVDAASSSLVHSTGENGKKHE